jgi:hypothetical protein
MIVLKSLAIWLVFIAAESLNGMIRSLWLVPLLGTLQAHQISFIIGSFLMLAIATLFIRWLHTLHLYQLLGVGILWMVLRDLQLNNTPSPRNNRNIPFR